MNIVGSIICWCGIVGLAVYIVVKVVNFVKFVRTRKSMPKEEESNFTNRVDNNNKE